MKDEIKEILDKLKKLCYDDYCLEFSVDYIERKEEKLLLDYITNLQEENERLTELDENYPIEEQLEEALKYENIYKSRNEKAIELINAWLDGLNNDDIIILLNDLGNILQGKDKDE